VELSAQERARAGICLTRPVFLVLLTVLMWASAGSFPLWLEVGVTVAVVAAVAWDVRGAVRLAHDLRAGVEPRGRPPTC
jgi:hypothetical protein